MAGNVNDAIGGFNQTIQLLKLILDEIRNDNKTVQPKSVNTLSSNVIKDNSSSQIDNSTKELSSNSLKNANILSSVVKTISNKDTITGLRNFSALGILMKPFSKVFKTLVDTINYIDELNVDENKVKSFETIIKSVQSTVNMIPQLILSLVGIFAAVAVIGVLAPLAMKQIVIGFGAISAILVATALIIKLCSVITGSNTLININLSGNDKNTYTTIGAVKDMVFVLLSLSSLIIIAASIGFLAQYAWPQILIGFTAIAAVVGAVAALIILCASVSRGASVAAGEGWRGQIASFINSDAVKTGVMTKSVETIVVSLLSMSLLIVIAAAVGALAEVALNKILKGFAAIGSVLVIVGFTLWGLSALAKKTDPKQMLAISAALLAITVTFLAMSVLVIIAAGVGTIVQDKFGIIMAAVGTMALIIFAFTWLVGAVGALADVLKGIFKDGLIILASITGIVLALAITIGVIANVTSKVENVGGWGKMWATIGSMAGVVGAFGVLAAAIGALVGTNFIGPVILAAGIAGVAAITSMMTLIADAIIKIINVGEKVGDADIVTIGDKIVSAFISFSSTLINGFDELPSASRKMKKSSKILYDMLDPVMKFADMLVKFIGDGTTISLIDLSGNETNKVNLATISNNIVGAFVSFSNSLVKGFDEKGEIATNKMKKSAKRISAMLDPIQKYVEMISMFAKDENTLTLFSGEFDDAGEKYTPKNSVNIVDIGNNIVKAFSNFAATLVSGFGKIDVDGKVKREAERVGAMLDPIANFVRILASDIHVELDTTGTNVTSIKMKDSSGNEVTAVNPSTTFKGIALLIKNFGEIFNTELDNKKINIPKNLNDVILNVNNIISTLNDGSNTLSNSANSFEIASKQLNSFDDILIKNDKKRNDAINKYRQSIKELTTEIEKATDALTKMQDKSSININTAPTPPYANPERRQQPIITHENVNTSQQANNQQNNFDFAEFEKHIINALGSNTIRVKFNDSIEELIGELQIV